MRLLSDVNEEIVLVRLLLAALGTAKGILGRVVQLLVRAVHGKVFEDHLAVKAFEQTLDLPFVHLRLLIDAGETSLVGVIVVCAWRFSSLPLDRFVFDARGQQRITIGAE